ncbi:branched-chain amino acid transporter permease [Oceanobacter mangrovi]|uniref:branched-chain amino acid transporter permease n=1 Tax=Oceanobacter mangrovi TaxID=2862510 RepID=UPI001C8EFB22|nr:AzlD domain-containing protein [Oceanobacter mangrovi]
MNDVMDGVPYLLAVMVVMGLATFATRVLPFVILYRVADHPLLVYLGRYLPAMILMLLVLYSFRQEVQLSVDFLPQLGCLVLVGLLQWWLKQALVSIIAGTAAYMALVQLGWV